MGGSKIYLNSPAHMTKMATMPIYLKNLFLWNQRADDLETWYAASGARELPSLFGHSGSKFHVEPLWEVQKFI